MRTKGVSCLIPMSSQSDATLTGLGILSFLPPELRLMMYVPSKEPSSHTPNSTTSFCRGPYAENLIQAPDSSPSRFAQAPNLGRKAGHSSLDTTWVLVCCQVTLSETPSTLTVKHPHLCEWQPRSRVRYCGT